MKIPNIEIRLQVTVNRFDSGDGPVGIGDLPKDLATELVKILVFRNELNVHTRIPRL